MSVAVSRTEDAWTFRTDLCPEIPPEHKCIEARARVHAIRSSCATFTDMTIYGHNVTMKQVRIAELKARLSEHLRLVRQGETIAVLDRDTPVAHIVPIRERRSIRVRKPLPGALPLHRIALPRPAHLKMDVVDLLLEERQNHR